MVRESGRHETGPDDLHIQPQPEQRPLPDGHVAVLGPFAPADEHGPPFEVDVSEPQGDELTPTQATGVEDLQNGAISQAEGHRDIRGREEPGHLGGAQGGLR